MKDTELEHLERQVAYSERRAINAYLCFLVVLSICSVLIMAYEVFEYYHGTSDGKLILYF
jgi:hypothetical protein